MPAPIVRLPLSLLSLLVLAAAAACAKDPPAPYQVPDAGTLPAGSLRAAAAASGKLMGAALSQRIGSASYANLAGTELNYVTPEYQMKWDPTETSPGNFDYTLGDQLVTFAQQHDMQVKGHTLVWYQSLPSWVSALPDAASVDAALQNHITNVVTHWKGQVVAWDVVNEAVNDGAMDLRSNVFLDKLGPSYVEKAFRYARAADPDVLLFYNDYGGEAPGAKATGIYNLVKSLVDAGAPIDGVGFQMHIASGDVTGPVFAATIQPYIDLGLKVNVSEMDVRVHAVQGGMGAQFAAEAATYHDIVAVCVAQPLCHAITVWGLTDDTSWINGPGNTFYPKPDYPLLFDASFAAKPDYVAVIEAFMGH